MQQQPVSAYLLLPTGHCFDHALLAGHLKKYHSVRDKISLMLERGEIIRLRRGLYIRSRLYGGTVEPLEVANLVYGPSYVSLEYALSYYGMIPERVEAITSVTPKRTKTFATPVGTFSYEHIPIDAYAAGISLDNRSGTGILIATREKALCDRVALAANIRTIGEIEAYILKNLRIDEGALSGMSAGRIAAMGQVYHMQRTTLFAQWFHKKYGK